MLTDLLTELQASLLKFIDERVAKTPTLTLEAIDKHLEDNKYVVEDDLEDAKHDAESATEDLETRVSEIEQNLPDEFPDADDIKSGIQDDMPSMLLEDDDFIESLADKVLAKITERLTSGAKA